MIPAFLRMNALSLVKAGYNVYNVVFSDQPSRVERGINVVCVPPVKGGRLKRMILGPKKLYKTILALQDKPSIVHFHDPELMFVGRKLQKRGYQVVYDLHEIIAEQILDKTYIPAIFRPLVAWSYKKMERWITWSMTHIYVTEIPEDHTRRAAVLRNMTWAGDYPEKVPYVPGKRPLRLLYVGGVSETRGALLILDVVKAMTDMGESVKLDMLGWVQPASLLEILKTKVREFGLEDKVYISGQRVAPVKIHKAMETADIGLCLLYPEKNYVKAYPVKVFEYMRARLPVVATDIPYWYPLIRDPGSGIHVSLDDPAEIAREISALSKDKKKMEEMGNAGRSMVENFWCWEKESEVLLRLYEDILSKGPGGIFAAPTLTEAVVASTTKEVR